MTGLGVLAGLMLYVSSSCQAADATAGDSHMMNETKDVRFEASTLCIGRFLIDVPLGSTVGGATYKYKFANIAQPVEMERAQFDMEIKERLDRLKSIPHKKEASLLRTAVQLDNQSQVLAFWGADYKTALVEIEGYKWMEGKRFFITTDAGADRQALAISNMIGRLSGLRPRADTDIPTDPGYCFGGGFIANSEWENEEARVDIDVPGHPDAYFTVWFYPLAAGKRDKPLLDRMGGALGALNNLASSAHVLRKGDRNIGPFQEGDVTIGPFIGQEYLTSVPNSGGLRGHYFQWVSQGEGTLQEPHVSIEFSTGERDTKGNPQQTRLTDEQAMQLWDRVVGSFRLRPTRPAPVKTSDAAPPRIPLGELAATGRPCPQAGWWECVELSAPVRGGKRQRFALGETMPAAVLLGEPSVWQKLRGEQPSHPIATVWKLVAHDPAAASGSTAPRAPLESDGTG